MRIPALFFDLRFRILEAIYTLMELSINQHLENNIPWTSYFLEIGKKLSTTNYIHFKSFYSVEMQF